MSDPSVSGWARVTGLPVAVLVVSIRAYQVIFSQLFTGSCRFIPSCSTYAEEAVVRHGALRGSWLAVRRLARCHPFCVGGLDQVPTSRRREGS